ncbi:19335_t:CDS:1, partial [Funneliformis geosporum]
MSNWFESIWPIKGEDVRYIKARTALNIKKWSSFSPAQIHRTQISMKIPILHAVN